MKTNFQFNRNQGSALLVTLVITGVLGFTLASYLSLVGTQNRSIWRSQTWNASIPVAEAGIEEAIMHLNKNCLSSDITRTPVNWNADGWISVSDGIQMTRWLGSNRYVTTIMTAAPYSTSSPAILSEGYVPALMASRVPDTFFAAIGTVNQTPPAYVGRKVKVTTTSDGFMSRGLVARDSIDLKGNGVTTDSFDSENPAYSTDGQYDPAKRRDHGDVAVNYGLTDSLGIGNANIFGNIAVGPGGNISIGPNGQVGDFAWNSSHNGIQPGHSRDDMNVSFPNVQVPFTGGYSTPSGRTVSNTVITATSVTNTTVGYPTGSGIVYTNLAAVTTVSYPVSGTYIGSVITNTFYVTSNSFPASGTYQGVVATNTASITSSNTPSAGTYLGSVTTNTVATTSTNHPASGTYIGGVSTNYNSVTSSNVPAAGSFVVGTLVTNIGTFTTTTYPSSSYGPVTTNTTYVSGQKNFPAAGTYIGSVTTTTSPTRYAYNAITGYTYQKVTGYTYNQTGSYSYAKITTYSYEQLSGYSYLRITGYTVAHIVSYSLVLSTYTTNYTSQYYDFVLDSGNYKISSLSGNVLVLGDVVLYVTDSLNVNQIQINASGRLRLYNAAASFSASGNTFINTSGLADRLWYYGLPSNTSIRMHGNAGMIGVIYAPQASLVLGGGGNDTTDFIGASLSFDVKLNGHFNFHYDESLARKGPSRGYIIQSWDEIKLSDTN